MKTIEKIQLEGVDANLEISLLEYGIAWFKTANEITFVYSTGMDENCDCSNFCLSSFDLNTECTSRSSGAQYVYLPSGFNILGTIS